MNDDFIPFNIGTQKGTPTVAFAPVAPPAKPKLVMGHLEGPGVKKLTPSTALPIIGSIGGAVAGGVAGAPLGPLGIYGGGVAGASAGGAAGEALGQRFEGKPLNTKQIATTGVEQGAFQAIGGPVASLAGKVLKVAGQGIAKTFIPTSAKEAQLLQSYKAATPFLERMKILAGQGAKKAPQTAAQTAFDKGLVGTESMIGIQAKRAANKLWDGLINPALTKTPAKVNMPAFFAELEKKIVSETPELSRQKELLNALSALKDDYTNVSDVPLAQLQKFKEGWAKFIPDKAYKGKPIAGSFRDIQNMAAKNAREVIYGALGPNVKQAYFDYGNMQALQELGQKAMAQGLIPPGGTFTGLHALYELITVPIGTIGGQTVYKVGNGIELLGPPGVLTLGQLLSDSQTNQADMSQPESIQSDSTDPKGFQPLELQ